MKPSYIVYNFNYKSILFLKVKQLFVVVQLILPMMNEYNVMILTINHVVFAMTMMIAIIVEHIGLKHFPESY